MIVGSLNNLVKDGGLGAETRERAGRGWRLTWRIEEEFVSYIGAKGIGREAPGRRERKWRQEFILRIAKHHNSNSVPNHFFDVRLAIFACAIGGARTPGNNN